MFLSGNERSASVGSKVDEAHPNGKDWAFRKRGSRSDVQSFCFVDSSVVGWPLGFSLEEFQVYT